MLGVIWVSGGILFEWFGCIIDIFFYCVCCVYLGCKLFGIG